ncbi:MAG: crossover junction endodeoxyribonuclease RuvC [Endomicrobium sp.]|jgi:crossover junction endodeoxyribonuclease RuvC|nr:crossover junction endodeoxyribonuclease RuvC [Endomicrobium sp.]
MRILGIDPGISLTGWGIIDTSYNKIISAVKYGYIKTTSSKSLAERLKIINIELQLIINKYKPHVAAIEELFFLKNLKNVVLVTQARGAIILTASMNDISVFEYNPKIVKMALTGYGSACKNQIQCMVKVFLKLEEIPKPDDVADALAVAICHANIMKI